jgi:hypothetical protein
MQCALVSRYVLAYASYQLAAHREYATVCPSLACFPRNQSQAGLLTWWQGVNYDDCEYRTHSTRCRYDNQCPGALNTSCNNKHVAWPQPKPQTTSVAIHNQWPEAQSVGSMRGSGVRACVWSEWNVTPTSLLLSLSLCVSSATIFRCDSTSLVL